MTPLDPHESVACWHWDGPPGHTVSTCCCCDGNPCPLVTDVHDGDHRRWLFMALTQEVAS